MPGTSGERAIATPTLGFRWSIQIGAGKSEIRNPKSEIFSRLDVKPKVHDLSVLDGVGLALELQGALVAAGGERAGVE